MLVLAQSGHMLLHQVLTPPSTNHTGYSRSYLLANFINFWPFLSNSGPFGNLDFSETNLNSVLCRALNSGDFSIKRTDQELSIILGPASLRQIFRRICDSPRFVTLFLTHNRGHFNYEQNRISFSMKNR